MVLMKYAIQMINKDLLIKVFLLYLFLMKIHSILYEYSLEFFSVISIGYISYIYISDFIDSIKLKIDWVLIDEEEDDWILLDDDKEENDDWILLDDDVEEE